MDFFTFLFADDTTLQDSDCDLTRLTSRCNSNLKIASRWFQANRLTLNAKKTKCMVFGPNGNSNPLPFPLKIQGTNIERIGNRFSTKFFKLVGVKLDDQLNWSEHSNYVSGKVAKANYGLARAKKILPTDLKLMVYNSLIKCHLDYCLSIWGDCCSSNKRGLLKLQKKLQ